MGVLPAAAIANPIERIPRSFESRRTFTLSSTFDPQRDRSSSDSLGHFPAFWFGLIGLECELYQTCAYSRATGFYAPFTVFLAGRVTKVHQRPPLSHG